MVLEVISPEETLFYGKVNLVKLPGVSGGFTILPGHAPIISSLVRGNLSCQTENKEEMFWAIEGGFVEVKNNEVTVCIDGLLTDIWRKTEEFWVQ